MVENDVLRGLLLGFLALREGLVDAPALLGAFDAWCLDRSRSLGQILRERGVLAAEDGDRLDTAVEEHALSRGDDHGPPPAPSGPDLEAAETQRRPGQADVAETSAYPV